MEQSTYGICSLGAFTKRKTGGTGAERPPGSLSILGDDEMTQTQSFLYAAPDGLHLYTKRWYASGAETKGTLLVAHGLGETADYYDEFAFRAACRGFGVFVPELRGHGRTAGDISKESYRKSGGNPGADSLHKMADDLSALAGAIKTDFPGKPLFLLGHSMGSVAAQLSVLSCGKELSGLILTGIPYIENIPALLQTATREISQRGLKAECRDTFIALFGDVNRPFEPVKTPLDWITSDEELARWSLALPYTAVLFNNEFYRDFLLAVAETQNPESFKSVPRNLPVLLLGGGSDAISHGGDSISEKVSLLRSLAFRDVNHKSYPGLRHSILREKERGRVMDDIFRWIEPRLKRKM